MRTLQDQLDVVASKFGAPSWNDLLFRIVIHGNTGLTVSDVNEMIGEAFRECVHGTVDHLRDQSFDGWTESEKNGYATALKSIEMLTEHYSA